MTTNNQEATTGALQERQAHVPASLDEKTLSALILNGDLSRLSEVQRVEYYKVVCNRVGLDPAAQPFKLLNLQGKLILYAGRECAAQLNRLHDVSHAITSREFVQGFDQYVVTCRATMSNGRYTDSIGAVAIPQNAKGDALSNLLMKAETKAKRRATLDLLGLGMLDESEIDTIPGAKVEPVPGTGAPQKAQKAEAASAEDVEGVVSVIPEENRVMALEYLKSLGLVAMDAKDFSGLSKKIASRIIASPADFISAAKQWEVTKAKEVMG